MVDQIIELENNKKYVILDKKVLNSKVYYFGLRLDDNEEPTNKYLFFEEIIDNGNICLLPIEDEKMKGLLITTSTINYLNKAYDEA